MKIIRKCRKARQVKWDTIDYKCTDRSPRMLNGCGKCSPFGARICLSTYLSGPETAPTITTHKAKRKPYIIGKLRKGKGKEVVREKHKGGT